MAFQEPSPFFNLPKELRLAIYEYALESDTHVKIGTYAVNNRNLADWPIQPGLVRTCSLFRDEALPIYFSQTNFHIALQSPTGMKMTVDWIKRNARSCSWAFNHLRHIKLIVGAGVYTRPEEFALDLQRRELVSCRTQLPQRTLMFGEDICGHPGFHYLNYQLRQIPERWSEEFDIAAWLEPILWTLFQHFTLEDADGFML